MKKILSISAGLVLVVSAQAQLFNNADGRGLLDSTGLGTQTRPAGGFYSVLQNGNGTFGSTTSTTLGFSLADDFTNSVAWNLTGASVYAYQTGATAATISGGTLQIFSGSPTGTLEATGTFSAASFTNVYRAASTALGDTRHVQQLDFSLSGTLSAGTHWLVWSLTPDPAFSGPFTPYLSQSGAIAPSGSLNAMQGSSTGFVAITDGTNVNSGQDLPFLINGTAAVPEPASLLAMGAGLVAFAVRRKKK